MELATALPKNELLVCPQTRLPLQCVALAAGAVRRTFTNRQGEEPTGEVLLRADGRCAYPIVNGIPVLLAPEAYMRANCTLPSTALPQYAEAYAEMPVYNSVAAQRTRPDEDSHQRAWLRAASRLGAADRASFPEPSAVWCDQLYEYSAQLASYRLLAPLAGKRVLQVGGTGIHALKFLLAGASEAWLATPMLGEARFTLQLAAELGLAGQFHAAVAIGEELPFRDSVFHGIYSSSCLHHMVTSMAAAAARRVLVPDGVYVAIDPWRAPLRRLGVAVLGQREQGVHCYPLDPQRIAEFRHRFPSARCQRFGALARYGLLGLQKLRVNLHDAQVRGLMRLDERLCRALPPLRRLASSALVTARREAVAIGAAAHAPATK